jgi:hypothetical protein
MFLGVLAIGLAAGSQAMAGGWNQIPFPIGNFSLMAQGTEASCSGNSCAELSVIEVGNVVRDASGNGCGTHAAVVNTVPPGASLLAAVPSVTFVVKVLHYDPTTGTGDESLNEYSGGSCQGAIFNNAGATQSVSGTLHFVVSSGGQRIDSIVTQLSIAGLGGYSISFTERQQASLGNQQ